MSETNLPTVNFNADRTLITEGGEAQLLTFSLSEPAPAGGLVVNINIDDPDGEGADTEFPPELISNIVDFGQVEEDGVITASLTIAEGETEAAFGILAIADDLDEGNETYSLTLLPDETYIADPNSTTITTTIEDNMTSPTVSITPETLIATEGETFAWNFSLDTPAPEGGLSLFLPITVNNDPAPGDVDYNVEGSSNISDFEFVVNNDVSVGLTFTIDEGATEANLVSEAIADEATEIDEIATFVLADGENYRANPEQDRVNLVLTEFPVVSLDTEEITAAEGDTFTWDFSLNQPAPEGGLTLFLPVTANNDPAPGDVEYNIDGSSNIADFEFVVEDDVSIGFNLTIAEGETEASLVSEVVADDVTEEDEIFTTVIADGTNYRANPAQSSVTTTLLNLPTISVVAEPTEVEEGEQLNFVFNLSEPVPEGGLVVDLDLVEDTDPAPGDVTYFVDGSENVTDFELVIDEESGLIDKALVTLAEGATSATLVNDVIADDVTEGPESATFALAEAEGYTIDPEVNEASYTLLDPSNDLNTTTSTSISLELEDLLVPALEAVADVTFSIDYISGIEDSDFIDVNIFADSIENYLTSEPESGDFFEVTSEDLAEFLVTDAGLGLSEVAESISVEFDVEPYPAAPFPFSVESTVEIAEI